MWYLISGSLMSLLGYITFINFLQKDCLDIYQHLICWFFIEYLYDYYNFSAGKFFLLDSEFRTLTRNGLIVTLNSILFARLVAPLGFFLLNLCLFLFFLVTSPKNFNNYYLNSFLIFCYVLLLYSFIYFNSGLIYLFLKVYLIFFLCLIVIIVYLYIGSLNLCLGPNFKYSYFLLKFFLYSSLFLLNILIFLTCLLNSVSDNIIQEFSLKILIPYTYLIL